MSPNRKSRRHLTARRESVRLFRSPYRQLREAYAHFCGHGISYLNKYRFWETIHIRNITSMPLEHTIPFGTPSEASIERDRQRHQSELQRADRADRESGEAYTQFGIALSNLLTLERNSVRLSQILERSDLLHNAAFQDTGTSEQQRTLAFQTTEETKRWLIAITAELAREEESEHGMG
jgi:hypothetical protein